MNVKQDLTIRQVGERYFLNSPSGDSCVYIMNETTYKIFNLIKEGNSISSIIEILHAEFDVDKNELTEDVNMCITDMLNAGVIIA